MRRKSKWSRYSEAELARFISLLARTGNAGMAAEAIGRHVDPLRLRRKRDPDFGAAWTAALATFRLEGFEQARAAKAGTPSPGLAVPKGKHGALRADGFELVVVPGGPRRPAQLRRAKRNQLTDAALSLFLETLAVSANLTFAARSIGATTHAIAYRRKRDSAFNNLVEQALEIGVEMVENRLLVSALRSLDVRMNDAAEVERVEAEEPECGPPSFEQLFAFLCKAEERMKNPPRGSFARRDQETQEAAARLMKLIARMRVEAGLPPEGG